MADPDLFPDQPEPEQHVREKSSDENAYSNISQNISALGSRLRVLEEQYTTLRNKSQLADNNLLEFEKDLRSDIKAIEEDLTDLKHMIRDLKDKLSAITSEMDNTVKEHEFKVVEKYIDLWNPGRFITREQLRKKLEEVLEEE